MPLESVCSVRPANPVASSGSRPVARPATGRRHRQRTEPHVEEAPGSHRCGSVVAVDDHRLDIGRFQNWALGKLAWNTNRGIFAEWLVGQALEVIGEDDARDEWGECDLYYRGIKIEVKTSGRGQAWKQDGPSTPQFGIRPLKQTWDKRTNEWTDHKPAVRVADVYVFCLHDRFPATNDNIRDPGSWKFWVVSTFTLNDELGPQKSVRLSTLDRLTERVGWSDLRIAVDRCVGD